MAVNIFQFDVFKRLKERKQKENQQKRNAIRQAVIQYYEDLNNGSVSIPAHLLADKVIKEVIKSNKDLDLHYKKLLEHKRLVKVVI